MIWAEREEIREIISTAICHFHDVMNIYRQRSAATRYGAYVACLTKHGIALTGGKVNSFRHNEEEEVCDAGSAQIFGLAQLSTCDR